MLTFKKALSWIAHVSEGVLGGSRTFPAAVRAALGRIARVAGDALAASSLVVLLLIVWQVVVAVFHPASYLLPSPISVWNAIWNPDLHWWSQIWITLQEIVGGFVVAVVAGIVLGVLIAWSQLLSRTLLPFIVFFNTLPKVAIAPLFIIYLGFGIYPNIVIAAVIAFFPIVINTSVGLLQTSDELIDLARSLDAPKWKIFLLLRLPNSIPYVLTGLKVSATFSVTGAVFGEFIASQGGLGNLIISTQTNLHMDTAFAALFWLAVLGMALYWLVALGGRVLFPWAESSSNDEA